MVEVPRELLEEELEAACAPYVLACLAPLEEAQDKVNALSSTVSEKEAKVKDLEIEMARRSVRGAALVRELEQAKALAKGTIK